MNEENPNPVLWQPTAERISATRADQFRRAVRPEAADTDDLWEWSVDEPGSFWRSVWQWTGVVGDPGDVDLVEADDFWQWRFLPNAELNIAENLLLDRDGANREAIIERRETGFERTTTWAELRAETAAMGSWMRSAGVEPSGGG